MGINVYSRSGNIEYGIKEWVVDTVKDIEKLPTNCEMGSAALCLEDGEVYFFSREHGWVIPGVTKIIQSE